jgi:enamine deaminase RidA (YjgF/YER057c/UK114 family)
MTGITIDISGTENLGQCHLDFAQGCHLYIARTDNVLKVNVYVTSVDMFPAVNEVYRRFFPRDYPARIFINVPAWNGGFDIEVDCIAAV